MTIANRRDFHRIPCLATPCFVTVGGRRTECELLDESIGGFRVVGIDPTSLRHNEPMSIEHRDEVVGVYATNVARDENARFCIGLQRIDTMNQMKSLTELNVENSSSLGYELDALKAEDWQSDSVPLPTSEPPEVGGSLINPFVSFGKQNGILCRIIDDRSSTQIRVEILGEKQFDVESEAVDYYTRDERRAELLHEATLEWLAGIYTQSSGRFVAPHLESILDFEFENEDA